MLLKEKHQDLLEWLAIYKYLTSSLLQVLGYYKNKGDITKSIKPLLELKKPLVKKIVMGFQPGVGRLDDLYFLTNYGKRFLIDDLHYTEDMIKIPRSRSIVPKKDYAHKVSMISFYIRMNMWLEQHNGVVDFLNYDFDKIGNNRNSNTTSTVTSINKINLKDIDRDHKNFIPDIITKFNVNDRDYLFLFEQHNGTSSKRLLEQLQTHLIALTSTVVCDKYSFNKSHRVVVVCELENVKLSVIKKLQANKEFEKFHKFFIFKTNDELEKDFFNNWMQIDEKQVTFIS